MDINILHLKATLKFQETQKRLLGQKIMTIKCRLLTKFDAANSNRSFQRHIGKMFVNGT